MCIGIPMQVIEPGPYQAWCTDGEAHHRVDTTLVGEQPAGAWLLVFQGRAREPMGAERARRVRDALRALGAAAQGRSVDHLFPDLVNREPELPDFLKNGKGR